MSDESVERVAHLTDDATDRTECWRCGYMRPTFESCPRCGGSCKPLTKRRQQEEPDYKTEHLHTEGSDGGE